jgi:multiple sugar transport system permease protein
VVSLLMGSAVYTAVISFTHWNLIGAPQFTGLQNYQTMLHDPAIRNAFLNTIYWVAGGLVLPVAVGLLLATLLESVPLQGLWKAILYFPVVLAPTVTGVIWQQIYSSQGLLNGVLGSLGLHSWQHAWLASNPLATVMMILTSTWRATGPTMLLFLVGLQTIPTETVEAAMLDGASWWTLLRRIKLPQIKPIMVLVITMAVVNSFTTYDIVQVMTGGGPYQSTETLAVTIYREAFGDWKTGYSAALAIVLWVITLGFSIVYLWRTQQAPDRGARVR